MTGTASTTSLVRGAQQPGDTRAHDDAVLRPLQDPCPITEKRPNLTCNRCGAAGTRLGVCRTSPWSCPASPQASGVVPVSSDTCEGCVNGDVIRPSTPRTARLLTPGVRRTAFLRGVRNSLDTRVDRWHRPNWTQPPAEQGPAWRALLASPVVRCRVTTRPAVSDRFQGS
jgi:hypothetical protein